MSDIIIRGMEMPKNCWDCPLLNTSPCPCKGYSSALEHTTNCHPGCPLWRLKRRIVYRGEVYNALESARVNALDGILSDPYKEGFHDGIKRAIQILANDVDDVLTITPASKEVEHDNG